MRKRVGKKFEPTQKHFEIAQKAAQKGLNHKEIAKVLGISPKTLQRHRAAFDQYLKKGSESGLDDNLAKVENALLTRCLGRSYDEKHTERRLNAAGQAQVTTKVVTKHVEPSDAAIFYYLTNRSKGRWKNAWKIDFPSEQRQIPVVSNMKAKPKPEKPKKQKDDRDGNEPKSTKTAKKAKAPKKDREIREK